MAGRHTVTLLLQACKIGTSSTAFDSRHPPSLTAFEYMERLQKNLDLTEEQVQLAAIYLDRFLKASREPLAYSSIYRLLGTAVVLAHKFDSDYPFSDRFYANVVGVIPRELQRLQRIFLQQIDYRLMYPEPHMYA